MKIFSEDFLCPEGTGKKNINFSGITNRIFKLKPILVDIGPQGEKMLLCQLPKE